MNILIIGNGFDLAHGLPTRYVDFLRYCKERIDLENLESAINRDFLEDNIWLKYFLSIMPDLPDSKTWIDFENEIALVISAFERVDFDIEIQRYINNEKDDVLIKFAGPQDVILGVFLKCIGLHCRQSGQITLHIPVQTKQDFIEYLYNALYNFAQMFERYIFSEIDEANRAYMTENRINELRADIKSKTQNVSESKQKSEQAYRKLQETQKKESELKQKTFSEEAQSKRLTGNAVSPHRKEWASYSGRIYTEEREYKQASSSYNIYSESLAKTTQEYENCLAQGHFILKRKDFGAVLSFNYTHTYQILYGGEGTKYCYIHGEARNAGETNLVFGTDDRLDRNSESSNFAFAKFKKYFQRILYKTGAEYKDWLSDNSNKYIVYIVGHSLDKTDHEVLREFFGKKCKIIICYHSPNDHIDKIQKVISIIGKDELIRRVHGSQWLIKFVDQYSVDGIFEDFRNNVNTAKTENN